MHIKGFIIKKAIDTLGNKLGLSILSMPTGKYLMIKN